MKDKVIITAAITGSIHTPTMSPHLPITTKEIADEAVRAYEAGAAVCHVHARNPNTGEPSSDLNLFKEIITSIKSRCNMVICITTGGGAGMTVAERVGPVKLYKPELASINAGSINFALFPLIPRYKEWKFEWEKERLAMTEDWIFPNTFKSMREYCAAFNEAGTKPEFEAYDAGMVNNIAFMIQAGWTKKPVTSNSCWESWEPSPPARKIFCSLLTTPAGRSAISCSRFASRDAPSFQYALSPYSSTETAVLDSKTISI